MLSNAVNVHIPENRTRGFTAVGTFEAIDLRKHFLVGGVEKVIGLSDLLQPCQEFFIGFPNALCVIQCGLEYLIHGDH